MLAVPPIFRELVNGSGDSLLSVIYRISSPTSRAIFQYLTQKFENFFTRNGVRLIAEGLEFKTIINVNVNAK